MKIYSATLMQELQTWSHVKTRPMFGFISFYRNRKIFAAIPKTRAWQSPHSLMFRLPSVDTVLRKKIEADPRIDTEESGLWFPFEVRSERDINGALEWLSIAYEQAGS